MISEGGHSYSSSRWLSGEVIDLFYENCLLQEIWFIFGKKNKNQGSLSKSMAVQEKPEAISLSGKCVCRSTIWRVWSGELPSTSETHYKQHSKHWSTWLVSSVYPSPSLSMQLRTLAKLSWVKLNSKSNSTTRSKGQDKPSYYRFSDSNVFCLIWRRRNSTSGLEVPSFQSYSKPVRC